MNIFITRISVEATLMSESVSLSGRGGEEEGREEDIFALCCEEDV
jgi:hypothetical protein